MKVAYKIIILCLFAMCVYSILFLSGQDGEEAFDTTYEIAKPVADVVYENPDNDQVEDVMLVVRDLGRVVAFTAFGVFLALNTDEFLAVGRKTKIVIIILISVGFSIFDEAHKLSIEGRHCTLVEILVNIIFSVAAGLLAYYLSAKLCKVIGLKRAEKGGNFSRGCKG